MSEHNHENEQDRTVAETKIVEGMAAWVQALAVEDFDFVDGNPDLHESDDEELINAPIKRYLVIFWCKPCDQFHFIATLARSDDEVMRRAWTDDRLGVRNEEFSKDGGMTGLVPLTAIAQTFLPVWLARHKSLPSPAATKEAIERMNQAISSSVDQGVNSKGL